MKLKIYNSGEVDLLDAVLYKNILDTFEIEDKIIKETNEKIYFIEIKSLDDLMKIQALAREAHKSNRCELILDFEDMTIEIYDEYRE
jgi:hypothetical protein